MRHRLPDPPTELTKRSWRFIARKTIREFQKDECTDLAAALTYYAILSLFPASIALLSLVGLVGQGPKTVETLLQILDDIGAGAAASTLEKTLLKLSESGATASVAFAAGIATALWSASGYIGAFGRALNRVYGVQEGRPFWKLRPWQLLVTVVLLVMAALVALALVMTGSIAKAVGDAIGVGDTFLLVWGIAKWPVVLGVVVLMVAILYYATPNVKQPKFRWLSGGAGVAILAWIAASAGFGFYVSNFGHYNKTYGTLTGAVVFLLWLWITNLALLFGAELDSEIERGRELRAGLPAEQQLQLEPRDTSGSDKAEKQEREDVELAHELREDHRSDQKESLHGS